MAKAKMGMDVFQEGPSALFRGTRQADEAAKAAARTAENAKAGTDEALARSREIGEDLDRQLGELKIKDAIKEEDAGVLLRGTTRQTDELATSAARQAGRALGPQEKVNEIAMHLAKNGQGNEAAKLMKRSPEGALQYARKNNLGPISPEEELSALKSAISKQAGNTDLAQINRSIRDLSPEDALKRIDGKKLSDGTRVRDLRTDIRTDMFNDSAATRLASQQAAQLTPKKQFEELSKRLTDSGNPGALVRYEKLAENKGYKAAIQKAEKDGYSHLSPEKHFDQIVEDLVESGGRANANKVARLSKIKEKDGYEAAIERSRGFDPSAKVTRGMDNAGSYLSRKVDDVGDSLREAASHPFKTALNLPGNILSATWGGIQAFRNLGKTAGMIGVTGAGMTAIGWGVFTVGALTDQHLLDGAVSKNLAEGLEDEASLIGQIANNTIEASAYLMEFGTHITGAIPNFGASVMKEFMRASEIYDDDYKYAEISDSFLDAGFDYLAGNGMQAFMHLTGYGILPQDAAQAYTLAARETDDPRELAEMSVRNLGVIIEDRKQTNPAYGTKEYGENLLENGKNFFANIMENEDDLEGTIASTKNTAESAVSTAGSVTAAAGASLSLRDHFSNAVSSVINTSEMMNMMEGVFGAFMSFVKGALDSLNETFGFSSQGVTSNGPDRLAMNPGAIPTPDPSGTGPQQQQNLGVAGPAAHG